MHPIFTEIQKGALLFDGATGTYARERIGFPHGPVEQACLTAPQQVSLLHKAYLDAGCRAIKTNTFAAYPGVGVRDQNEQKRIVLAAYELAARAAKPFEAYVFADIGPAQVESESAYIRMADCFLEAGANCFLLETLPHAEGVAQVAHHIKSKNADAFIAVSFAAGPDGFTRTGESVTSLVKQMDACADIDAVGLNCICGAYHMRRLIEQLPHTNKPLLAMPNAGYPHVVDGRTYYDSSPDYYARQVAACVKLGANIVGGCCGTRPEHIARIAQLLPHVYADPVSREYENAQKQQICKSRIKQKLNDGKRVILVELDPPRDADIAKFLDGAMQLKLAGADAITIADCPIGRARMDSSLLACKLRRELDIETMPHMTCRDRNVNATKALLLGLSMEGVHNVLAVTGDPVPTSDRGSVKSVFQFNSRVMARFVRGLEQDGEADRFFLCGALNINACNFDAELERAVAKEACGMEAFLTQPVLSEQAAKNIEKARVVLRGKLFGGLFPVVSHKNALFLSSEVAGIAMDDAVVRAYDGLDRVQSEEMAKRLCRHTAKRITNSVDGYYIMTPFLRTQLVSEIINELNS